MNDCARVCAREGRKFGLIWFGAAISLAEIEAGLWSRGCPSAVVLGHVVGGVMLFLAGMLGARLRKNGMECTQTFFGRPGMVFFAAANVLQLVGWTAVMLAQGTYAAKALVGKCPAPVLTLVLGALAIAWIFVGLRSFSYVTTVTMVLLLGMVAVLTWKVFQGGDVVPLEQAPSFWEIFELSLAMPLSWLPLISDYTKETPAPRTACAVSALVYTLGSLWMYAVGIGLARIGQDNITGGIVFVHMGIWALLIVLISTTTTTFLDAYSAGESAKAVFAKVPPKMVGCVVCLLGILLACLGIMDKYIDFLYLIASIFVPMATVMLVSWGVMSMSGTKRSSPPLLCALNVVAFVAGFLAYQFGQKLVPGLTPSVLAILVSGILALAVNLAMGMTSPRKEICR
ncbi:MAG: cytosine permease [Oligosphaeraceae bacterium]